LQELKENDIQIYRVPDCDPDEDEEFKNQNKLLKVHFRNLFLAKQLGIVYFILIIEISKRMQCHLPLSAQIK
jgi:hypothetical protein